MSTESPSARQFYDGFTGAFLRDYVRGNLRVDRQFRFLAEAISPADRNILVIGCGIGHVGRFLAGKARCAHIVASDLSGECIRLANRLFPHPRVEYRVLDALCDPIDGAFDLVVLPDVYEHIPASSRGVLHERLARVLGVRGRIALTVAGRLPEQVAAATRRCCARAADRFSPSTRTLRRSTSKPLPGTSVGR